MKTERFALTTAILLSLALTVTPAAAAGGKFKILHNFADGSDGGNPIIFATLAIDAHSNLYGATYYGGTACGGEGCGVIFEVARAGGKWSEKVLFDITDFRTQGSFDSPLTVDSEGDLYGCTARGPMFELTTGSPPWNFNPIWPSGCEGSVGLTFDGAGNIYGVVGNDFNGDIGELSRSSDGWVYTKLYEFCPSGQNCRDGLDPLAPFSWDAKGNLYGTTYEGGYLWPNGCYCGVAFQMTPNSDGTWTYHVLHRFSNHADGGRPYGSLTVDASGAAYGTTTYGGPHGNGNVFKLTPSNGRWKLSVLYGFPNSDDGLAPGNDLVFDKVGNLYGTAGSPACNGGCGVIFKLSPQSSGKWNYSVLHRFSMTDGDYPNGLTMDGEGNLFGTTTGGGKFGYGVVFEITP